MEGKKNGGRRGRKGPAGASEEQDRASRLCAPSVWVQCRSTSGQCPVTNVGVPSKKIRKNWGIRSGSGPVWQYSVGSSLVGQPGLEGDLQLVESVRGTSSPPA